MVEGFVCDAFPSNNVFGDDKILKLVDKGVEATDELDWLVYEYDDLPLALTNVCLSWTLSRWTVCGFFVPFSVLSSFSGYVVMFARSIDSFFMLLILFCHAMLSVYLSPLSGPSCNLLRGLFPCCCCWCYCWYIIHCFVVVVDERDQNAYYFRSDSYLPVCQGGYLYVDGVAVVCLFECSYSVADVFDWIDYFY